MQSGSRQTSEDDFGTPLGPSGQQRPPALTGVRHVISQESLSGTSSPVHMISPKYGGNTSSNQSPTKSNRHSRSGSAVHSPTTANAPTFGQTQHQASIGTTASSVTTSREQSSQAHTTLHQYSSPTRVGRAGGAVTMVPAHISSPTTGPGGVPPLSVTGPSSGSGSVFSPSSSQHALSSSLLSPTSASNSGRVDRVLSNRAHTTQHVGSTVTPPPGVSIGDGSPTKTKLLPKPSSFEGPGRRMSGAGKLPKPLGLQRTASGISGGIGNYHADQRDRVSPGMQGMRRSAVDDRSSMGLPTGNSSSTNRFANSTAINSYVAFPSRSGPGTSVTSPGPRSAGPGLPVPSRTRTEVRSPSEWENTNDNDCPFRPPPGSSSNNVKGNSRPTSPPTAAAAGSSINNSSSPPGSLSPPTNNSPQGITGFAASPHLLQAGGSTSTQVSTLAASGSAVAQLVRSASANSLRPPQAPAAVPSGPSAADLLKDKRRVSLRLIGVAEEESTPANPYKPPPMFGIFGSFERETYFQELRALCKNTEVLPFIRVCDSVLQKTLPSLALLDWINNPGNAPPESFFTMPVIAWPMETIKSLASYYLTAQKVGFSKLAGYLLQGGIFASGKGIFGSLAVACSGTLEEFYTHADTMIRFSITTGLMYQEHADKFEATMEGGEQRSFSLLVVNVSIPCLQLLLQHHNTTSYEGHIGTGAEDHATASLVQPRIVPFSELQISRAISHRAAVVTGHPVDLIRFDQLLVAFGHATGVKIHRDYLPAWGPENSPFFNQLLKMELMHGWKADGLLDKRRRMYFRMPFFSPVDAREWSAVNGFMSQQLFQELAAAVTCAPQDLTCSLQQLRPSDCVLEFGTSSLRIGQLISWTKRSIVILAQPWDTVVQSALPSPRRSAQRQTRAATFGKAATWSHVLNNMHWSGKPSGVGTGEYTAMDCSFFDLGLLLDADKVSGMNNVVFGDQSMASPPDATFFGRQANNSLNSFPVPGAAPTAGQTGHLGRAAPMLTVLGMNDGSPSKDINFVENALDEPANPLSIQPGILQPALASKSSASNLYAFSSLSQFPSQSTSHLQVTSPTGPPPRVFTPEGGLGSNTPSEVGFSTKNYHGTFGMASGVGGGDGGPLTPPKQHSTSSPGSTTLSTGSFGLVHDQLSANDAANATQTCQQHYVAIPCNRNNAVFVYQVAPLIRYLEMQHRATLTQGAVEVTRQLARYSGVPFPTHTMLMCPTVFALFEYWDTLEYVSKRYESLNKRDQELENNVTRLEDEARTMAAAGGDIEASAGVSSSAFPLLKRGMSSNNGGSSPSSISFSVGNQSSTVSAGSGQSSGQSQNRSRTSPQNPSLTRKSSGRQGPSYTMPSVLGGTQHKIHSRAEERNRKLNFTLQQMTSSSGGTGTLGGGGGRGGAPPLASAPTTVGMSNEATADAGGGSKSPTLLGPGRAPPVGPGRPPPQGSLGVESGAPMRYLDRNSSFNKDADAPPGVKAASSTSPQTSPQKRK